MMINDASGPANMFFGDFVGSGYLWLPPIMEDPDDPEVCWWGGGDHLYKLKRTFPALPMNNMIMTLMLDWAELLLPL